MILVLGTVYHSLMKIYVSNFAQWILTLIIAWPIKITLLRPVIIIYLHQLHRTTKVSVSVFSTSSPCSQVEVAHLLTLTTSCNIHCEVSILSVFVFLNWLKREVTIWVLSSQQLPRFILLFYSGILVYVHVGRIQGCSLKHWLLRSYFKLPAVDFDDLTTKKLLIHKWKMLILVVL